MSYLVTGGAGFIGSCVVKTLNDMGIEDIIIVDNVASTEKWMNLRNKRFLKYIHKSNLFNELDQLKDISVVIHLGACSSTTQTDFDYLWNNNVKFSEALWKYCTEKQIRFIYASSAATYGNGENVFDDTKDINTLLPMNGYGYSKQAFDQWTEKQEENPVQHVVLKFFNVYGPNEYHKGTMASMVYHGYNQIVKNGKIQLFRSYHPDYKDGEQVRDFVYVKDICKVILFFLENPNKSGIFNIGTGKARSFHELAAAIFHTLDREVQISYIDMPENLVKKYQYFTQAKIDKLIKAGYKESFSSIEEGIYDYVSNYLANDYFIY